MSIQVPGQEEKDRGHHNEAKRVLGPSNEKGSKPQTHGEGCQRGIIKIRRLIDGIGFANAEV